MTSIPIPFTGATLELHPPGVGPSWLGLSVAALVVPLVGGFLVWLYRREAGLVPRRTAVALFALRAAAVGVVLLTLLFDPVVSRVKREEVPGRVLVAVDRSDSMRVTDPHRPLAEKLRIARALRLTGDTYDEAELATLIERAEQSGEPDFPPPDTAAGKRQRERLAKVLDRLDALTRLGVAVRTVGPDGVGLMDGLREKHAVEAVGFDQVLAGLPTDDPGLKKTLAPDQGLPADGTPPKPSYSDLKLPLAHAHQQAEANLLGVVVLTDGRHNWGESPVPLAEQLGQRKVPVYPVLVAPTTPPPDVSVVSARPQAATVFKGSIIPVEVEVRVTGWPAGDIRVTLTPPADANREPVVETIPHAGRDAVYRLALKTKLDTPGPQSLTVTAEGQAPDKFPGNNRRTARVNVVKDRARVMLIDGEARWEFHYLHTALGRDENMDVRSIVFRQPRVTTATDEEVRPLGIPARRLPDDPEALTGYDVVVLGDAEPGQLSNAHRERLERYVADAGGTLVMVAGKRAMPLAYTAEDDPLRKLLPIKNPQVYDEPNGFRFALTPEADRNWFLQLADTTGASREVWGRFPPHFWAVVGEAKDGAEVLAGVPGKAPREAAVVARQNYGFGRVLYVGIDSTWRWRFKAGDYFHHRFWGQVAQWAASDRLLPTANAAGTIRFGPREPAYRAGQDVEVVVRATEAVRKLGPTALKGVRVVKLTDGKEAPAGLSPLTHPDGRPRELTTTLKDLAPGKYAVELDIPEWADQLQGPPGPDGRASKLRARFEVLPPDGEELVELSGNRDLLEQIAAASGGKVYTPDTVGELVEALAERAATREELVERPARRSWWLLGAFVLLIVAEWSLRKWSGLP